MLLMRSSVTATVGWLLMRLHVEAFLASGSRPTAGAKGLSNAETYTSVLARPSCRRAANSGLGRQRHGFFRMPMTKSENAVQSPVGAPNGQAEDKPVLDALIEQFTSPKNNNVTATVEEYLDLCDHALLTHLRERIESAGPQSTEGNAMKHVEEEINMAMQRRLAGADANLRCVLDLAPDIKRMEGSMRTLFREGKVDMAFMVMISMNLQRAKEAEGAENAVMLLTHLTTFIMGLQDERLNPEVKLLRVLLRTDCDGVRKSTLQEQLQLPNHDIFLERAPAKDKVQPHLLQEAITDMITEVEELGQAMDVGLTDSLRGLQVEIDEVVKGSQRPGPFRQ